MQFLLGIQTVTSGLNSRAYKPNSGVIFWWLLLFGNDEGFYLIPENGLLVDHLEFCPLLLGW